MQHNVSKKKKNQTKKKASNVPLILPYPSDKNALNLRYHIFQKVKKTLLREIHFRFKKLKTLENVNYQYKYRKTNNLNELYVETHSWNSNILGLKSGHDFSF